MEKKNIHKNQCLVVVVWQDGETRRELRILPNGELLGTLFNQRTNQRSYTIDDEDNDDTLSIGIILHVYLIGFDWLKINKYIYEYE